MHKINLYGPPSVGKSMQSALIFGKLKLKGLNAELVTEFAKQIFWSGKNIKDGGATLQLEIFINQLRKEEEINGVDFLVTDSPLVLNAYYSKSELTRQIAIGKLNDTEFHFWLTRSNAKFEKEGRIHNEEESRQIENEMKQYLKESGVNLVIVDCAIEDRADWIIDYVLKNKKDG